MLYLDTVLGGLFLTAPVMAVLSLVTLFLATAAMMQSSLSRLATTQRFSEDTTDHQIRFNYRKEIVVVLTLVWPTDYIKTVAAIKWFSFW